MLEKHTEYMRKNSDSFYGKMTETEMKERLCELSKDEHLDENEMREKISSFEEPTCLA